MAHPTQTEPAAPANAGGCPIDHAALARAQGCPVSPRAAEFDPFGDGYQQDPPEYVRWAREQEPVFYSPKLGYWVVTRYDDIKAVFRDNHTFSPSIALEKITPTGPEANAVLATYGYAMNRTLVNEDEPAHMPRRRALMDPFTPEALKHHEPMVRRLTREYVDRFIDDGRADLVDQMLWEVPLTVALHFLGVPEEDMDRLREYSIAHTVNTWGRPKPEEQVAVAHAVGNFWQLAGKILDKMRQDPDAPGWMQYGIRKQKDYPDVVTDSYLHSMMMAGIVAAHETTANASANAIKLLLQHPDAWRELCEDPGLLPNAVEECLRHNGSVAAWRRLATRDTEIAGVPIPAGAKLLIVSSSANHDERHFADADFFDIRRENASDQLTFGYGAHQCMGKNLARMEMQIFLEELTRRLPHLRLAEQRFTYVPNTSFRGPEHLWVEWNPADNPERRDSSLLAQRQPVRIGEPSTHAISRKLVVASVTRAADGIARIRLESPDGKPLPRWTPGSHIDVECGDTGLSRQYSLCGDPAVPGALEIAVLREADGRGGSAWIHEHLRPGGTVRVRGPRNHFRMDESAARLIFIAGGIGITPISAMARRARELGLDYQLHYSGRARGCMALLDDLAQLHGERLHLHVSDEGGRNDFAALLAQPDAGAQIYACGPERMLAALQEACAGWPEDALRVEHFHSTLATLDPSREHAFEAELKDSGIVLQVPADQTLLAALRAANIDVQSDCEEGLCGSCEVRVLDGAVDHRDVVLTRAEREAGTRMMACCSRAQGGRIVLEL
ncbi:Cytochrome P450 116 [Achromobacter denitrificans]|uniref:cytochrome P450/oxidoreductase n=1 Tax=Achromobacter denitrificans TaxID=32002 RepID=UPI00078935DC|nr:cytochrome P450/oxidoreductase [Achromobacter denitrificans]OLU07723.1 cytochrome [Achromobacter denitrificans]QKH41237.1 cytochrome P450 [Achromobacter denitrificans]QKH51619.1 cytochrome P450 [Achromobacter denitrificans]CAB3720101.1 Carnitine monooxygenase reductase subunit [Achromobacter denitrificans]SUU27480.1 Cytochrome P450 116 [Achromobacter denitrificans]